MLTLNAQEIDTALAWYEHCNEDSCHYGGPALLVPSEARLADKLKANARATVQLSEDEAEVLKEWMQEALTRWTGSAIYALPAEKSLYDKLTGGTEGIPGRSDRPEFREDINPKQAGSIGPAAAPTTTGESTTPQRAPMPTPQQTRSEPSFAEKAAAARRLRTELQAADDFMKTKLKGRRIR